MTAQCRRLILTHGFGKSGDKTPKREIERAESCKHDFEGRVKHEK
jgi:phage-related protein